MKAGHCKTGLCAASWRMGGCECACERCSDAMRIPDKPRKEVETAARKPSESPAELYQRVIKSQTLDVIEV